MPDLAERFHGEMVGIYKRALSERDYKATRFLAMVNERGGLRAAKDLLYAPGLSEGFVALWERRRLDLTMEALILQEPWNSLFTKDELAIARERLENLGYGRNQPR